MDRPQFRIVAACSLALLLLLASAGCRGVPSRQVPPEQPYADPTSAGFGAVEPPSLNYGGDYGGDYGMGDPSSATQSTDPYNSGASEANPYGDYGAAPGVVGVPGLDSPIGDVGAANPFPDAGQDSVGSGLPDAGISPP